MQANKLIDAVVRGKTILYMDWCPSHSNIVGNNLADEAVKIGATRGRGVSTKLGKTEVYGINNPWSAKPVICHFRGVGSLYCFPRSPKIDFNNTEQA